MKNGVCVKVYYDKTIPWYNLFLCKHLVSTTEKVVLTFCDHTDIYRQFDRKIIAMIWNNVKYKKKGKNKDGIPLSNA